MKSLDFYLGEVGKLLKGTVQRSDKISIGFNRIALAIY